MLNKMFKIVDKLSNSFVGRMSYNSMQNLFQIRRAKCSHKVVLLMNIGLKQNNSVTKSIIIKQSLKLFLPYVYFVVAMD